MGKRSDFLRVERDVYPTPREAVFPLLPYLSDVQGFAETFVGDGLLAGHLEQFGHECRYASDVSPGIEAEHLYHAAVKDFTEVTEADLEGCSHVISNPPWPMPRGNGEPTLGVIRHFAAMRPTWLLLAADFMHNVYAEEVMAYCVKVVSIGRVKWIEGSKNSGVDNAAWFLFDRVQPPIVTIFHARTPRKVTFAADITALV